MKEDINNDEESLEELLEDMTEEELDKKLEETFKDDILDEDEIKTKFTHMNTAALSNNNSALKDREIVPLENLEEKLIEEDEEDTKLESQEIIEYGISEDEIFDSHYVKPKTQGPLYDADNSFSRNGLESVQDVTSINSEMAFVRKSMKSEYVKPSEINLEKPKKDNDSKFIQDFKKMSDDYKTG